MIDVEYAKGFQNLCNLYQKTHNFEDVLAEACSFNEDAFDKTMQNADKYGEWEYYKEQCTRPFRFYDIVEIAKTLRKLLKEEFKNEIKFNIKTERGYTDTLWITIKPQNENYLKPLPEYMEEYTKEYEFRHGVKHPYTSDEVFEKYAKADMNRLNEHVRKTIHNIIELFKMDNSDIMTDYFDVNYVVFYKLEVDGESHPGYTGI